MTKRQEKKLWEQAESLEDLGRLMADWLTGSMSYCPGCSGTPFEETEHLIPSLAHANRRGFVTTDSQPGFRNILGYDGNKWCQRPAVSGFVSSWKTKDHLTRQARRAGMRVFVYEPGHKVRDDYMEVTLSGGEVQTCFGSRIGRRDLANIWSGIGRSAWKDVLDAAQLTIVDPRWENRPELWNILGSL